MSIEREFQQQMVTSTGNLGLEHRSYDRLYWNWHGTPITNPDVLIRGFDRLCRVGIERSRVIFRGLIKEEAFLRAVNNGELIPDLEVALRIQHEWNADPLWLVYLARNSRDRKQINTIDSAQSKKYENWRNLERPPIQMIEDVLKDGYTFHNLIDEESVESLMALWGETFEWSTDGVVDLADRLRRQRYLESSQKTVWFSAISYNGELVAAAIANLNCQVLHDLGNVNTLIYAECNLRTQSFRAAHRAGMVIPRMNIKEGINLGQTLVQNVKVNDGLDPETFRDFTFMYLPQGATYELYPKSEVIKVTDLTSSCLKV